MECDPSISPSTRRFFLIKKNHNCGGKLYEINNEIVQIAANVPRRKLLRSLHVCRDGHIIGNKIMSLILGRVPSPTLAIGSLHITMPQAKLLAFASSAAIWHQAYVAPCLNIIFQSPSSCLPEEYGSTLLYEN